MQSSSYRRVRSFLAFWSRLQKAADKLSVRCSRDKSDKKKFKTYPIGYFHIDIAEVQTAEGKLYLYVAIDRTSKFAFVQLVRKTGRSSASTFLVALIAAVPYKIHTVLTDNGVQFTFPAAIRRWPYGAVT